MENWIVSLQTPEETSRILQILENLPVDQSVICFDFFDTIVTRCVPPEYTKEIAASLLSELLSAQVTGEEIYQYRKDIERHLCEENLKNSGELEFRFEDLSEALWAKLSTKCTCGFIDNSQRFYREMLSIEVAVEKQVQRVSSEMLHVLEHLHKTNLKIYLVSDFYLPETQFREILRWHDLEYLFSDVYVSSERGTSKGSGKIYPLICSDLNVTPDQLVMIGDNDHADVKMASEHGVRAIHLKPRRPETLTNCLNENRSATSLFDEIQIDKAQPFSEMGVSLWYFTHQLFQKLYEDEARDVFFLSKEGEFLKKLFELYQTELFGKIIIRTHYLLASRKSTFIASLRPLEKEDFSRLLDHYRDISLKDFLQSLNFKPSDITKICTVPDINYDQRLTEIRKHSTFKSLLKNDIFQNAYEKMRCAQKRNFLNYFNSFEIDFPSKELHLVDVGWKGSIQDNIYHILDKKTDVNGYFVGLLNPTEQYENNKKTGVLYDVAQLSSYHTIYNNNRSLFEMMLGASHGSADFYLSEPLSISVDKNVGSNDDYGKQSLSADNPFVMTLDLPEERELFKKLIEPLQKTMLRLNSKLNKAYMIAKKIPSEQWFARHHARMVYMPNQHEVSFFESLFHLENFGIFEFTDFSVSNSLSIGQKARNLVRVIRNPQLLETGIWPPIILKQMGIGWFQYLDGKRRYKNDI